jgi:hypothetical protein
MVHKHKKKRRKLCDPDSFPKHVEVPQERGRTSIGARPKVFDHGNTPKSAFGGRDQRCYELNRKLQRAASSEEVLGLLEEAWNAGFDPNNINLSTAFKIVTLKSNRGIAKDSRFKR